MKRILVLLCGAGLALCPALHAQDASPTPSTSGTETGEAGGHHHGGHGGAMNADGMLKHMTKALDLTADQQSKIKPILDTEVSAVQSAREDTASAPKDKFAKIRDARETANSQITAVLTPDQQTKFEAMHQRHGGRHGGDKGSAESSPASSPSAQ
ncbi:MAG TPA: hypothetical protein VHY22_11485 [Chthoniobacteraceae bacterium]|jgi:Spy/CpxP family protein refolding chaperone|nr:hypothetical protein [Chthoniobacteraceae bacterium]